MIRLPLPDVAATAVLALLLPLTVLLGDADTWWHVAAGQWIVAHGAVPDTDPFSWSMAGQPWAAHEWGAELLMAAAYRLAGWAGVLGLAAIAAALSAALLLRALLRAVAPGPALLLLALAAAGLAPELLARPHLLALPCLIAWCAGVVRARDEGRAPSLALLPVMTIWANLHGGFIVGLVFAAGLAIEAVLARPRALVAWGAFLLAAAAVAMLTPRGWHTLVFPITLLQLRSLQGVTEWHSIPLDRLQPIELIGAGLLYLFLKHRPRVSVIRIAMLLGLIWTACVHSRNQMLAGVLMPLLLVGPLGGARPVTSYRLMAAALLAVDLLMVGVRLIIPVVRGDEDNAPIHALDALDPRLTSLPVLNAYDFGGVLIFRGIHPFVDGRADLYGDAFLDRYDALMRPQSATLVPFLRATSIAWTILRPEYPAVTVLDRLPGWRRVYTDQFAVIHVRTDALPTP